MAASKTRYTLKGQRQKWISSSLIAEINKYKRHLQLKENIKKGKKAKKVSFGYATKDPKALAKFIMGGSR